MINQIPVGMICAFIKTVVPAGISTDATGFNLNEKPKCVCADGAEPNRSGKVRIVEPTSATVFAELPIFTFPVVLPVEILTTVVWDAPVPFAKLIKPADVLPFSTLKEPEAVVPVIIFTLADDVGAVTKFKAPERATPAPAPKYRVPDVWFAPI